jgi:hypothetical protein
MRLIITVLIINNIYVILHILPINKEARGGAVGLGTVLHVGRSRVRFPIVSMEFLIAIILRLRYSLGVDSALTEMSIRNISWWVKVAGA